MHINGKPADSQVEATPFLDRTPEPRRTTRERARQGANRFVFGFSPDQRLFKLTPKPYPMTAQSSVPHLQLVDTVACRR